VADRWSDKNPRNQNIYTDHFFLKPCLKKIIKGSAQDPHLVETNADPDPAT
jgi:hypothetical protein